MKRYITFILFIFITVGAFASGASEQNSSSSYKIHAENLVFSELETKGVQVYPSSTIVGIIDDYIYDVYDDDDYEDIRLPKTDAQFSNIQEFVSEDTDYSNVNKFFGLYVNDLLTENSDYDDADILYEINDELLAGLKANNAEKSFMILGNKIIICEKV